MANKALPLLALGGAALLLMSRKKKSNGTDLLDGLQGWQFVTGDHVFSDPDTQGVQHVLGAVALFKRQEDGMFRVLACRARSMPFDGLKDPNELVRCARANQLIDRGLFTSQESAVNDLRETKLILSTL